MNALYTILLLLASNIFMTLAWYGHLKLQQMGFFSNATPLIFVILLSWGIAFFEYCLQVPANRMGFEGNGGSFSLMQLKVIQEVITLVVFVLFSAIAFHMELRWNHFVACLLLIAAVYFVSIEGPLLFLGTIHARRGIISFASDSPASLHT